MLLHCGFSFTKKKIINAQWTKKAISHKGNGNLTSSLAILCALLYLWTAKIGFQTCFPLLHRLFNQFRSPRFSSYFEIARKRGMKTSTAGLDWSISCRHGVLTQITMPASSNHRFHHKELTCILQQSPSSPPVSVGVRNKLIPPSFASIQQALLLSTSAKTRF